MICPYNRKQEKQVLQVSNDYDEDGRNNSTQQIIQWNYSMMECLEEGCAVWRDGKCGYYGDTINNVNT